MQAWNLPDQLVRIVQHHHSPSACEHPACYGLALANQLAWEMEGQEELIAHEAEARFASMESLRLTADQLSIILEHGAQRFQATLDVFGSDLKATG